MSLMSEYYFLNGFKGRLFYFLHELLFVFEHNVLGMRHLRPAFLDAIRMNILHDDMVGVEIGVSRGKNAFSMLRHLSIKRLYLVDPYVDYQGCSGVVHSGDVDFRVAKRLLNVFSDRVVFIRDLSEDAVDRVPGGLDFVYVDGNPNYDFVRRDVELYGPKLRVGGIIGFDDVGYVSVSRVVIETIMAGGWVPVDGCVNCLMKVGGNVEV
jgi:hypothetical protein